MRRVAAHFIARRFICSRCRRAGDEVLGHVRGPLRDCERCKHPLYALLVVQIPVAEAKAEALAAAG